MRNCDDAGVCDVGLLADAIEGESGFGSLNALPTPFMVRCWSNGSVPARVGRGGGAPPLLPFAVIVMPGGRCEGVIWPAEYLLGFGELVADFERVLSGRLGRDDELDAIG